jgi:hypothetical protein
MVIFRAGLTQADGLGWIAVQFSEDGFGLAPGTLSAALHPAGRRQQGRTPLLVLTLAG